jgi:cell division protein FtsB
MPRTLRETQAPLRRGAVAPNAARRAPVSVQRLARRVGDTAYAARDVGAAAVSGDRPYLVGLTALLALAIVMLSGPFQSYMDGRARVEGLETKLEALEDENAALRARKAELRDPGNIELLAREQQGMIRPGEVPYAIVPPEVERPQISAPPQAEPDDVAWYDRVWQAVTDVFG